MHSRRMFEGYSVTLQPVSEAKGNPEPRELLDDDDDTTAEPRSEVRRASPVPVGPPATTDSEPTVEADKTPSAAPIRQTLAFEPVEGDGRKVTPVAFQAMADAARSMQALDDRKKTPSVVVAAMKPTPAVVRRPTPLGLGVVAPAHSKAPEFYSAETAPIGPVEPARAERARSAHAMTMPPEGMRTVDVVVRLSGALLKGRPAYVTLTLLSGEVLFEGDAVGDDEGGARAEVRAVVPGGVTQVKALVEAGGTYRTATVGLAESGPTDYTFA